MRKGDTRKGTNVGMNEASADKFGEEVPLPGCFSEMLAEKVLPPIGAFLEATLRQKASVAD